MIVDVNQLFEMLLSNNEEVQKRGLEQADKVKYLSIFVLPTEGKALWENCAKALSNKTDEELEPYLISILDWFKDANWPGFMIIYERLKKMPAKMLAHPYQIAVTIAQETRQDESKMWLTYLAGLITNQELLEFLPLDQQKLLKKYYKKWWVHQ